jgi:UDP-glucose 4-epimerase
VLVTGGAGFIGSNLVKFLNRKEPAWSIRVLDDFSTGLETNLEDSQASITRGSILDEITLNKAAEGVNAIIHLAAIGSVPRSVAAPRSSHNANATGTLNVLEAARGNSIEHVIVASSSSVYGSSTVMPRVESDVTRPLSPYAVTKLATEAYANAYHASYGLKTLALRFFNVYGPGQRADHAYAAVIPRFISAALAGEDIQVFGDGEQSRDFTYVDSVCSALHSACLTITHSASPVNLAFGTQTTLNELVRLLETEFGRELHVKNHEARPGDVRASQADRTLLNTLLPELEQTELSIGLHRTVQWFLDNA